MGDSPCPPVGKHRLTREMEGEGEGEGEALASKIHSTNSETLISEADLNPLSESKEDDRSESKPSSFSQPEIFSALEVVERDSVSIAESFTSLFASLRLALSEVTNSSVDHMHCFSDAVGRLQESTLDAATRGNRYINSCLRLNEEMKGIDSLATELKILRRNVDALDSAVNTLL